MAGIYIHVPFCTKACHYCDFHFSTNLKTRTEMVSAICGEITLRQGYLSDATIETLYFGGGTPSILSAEELGKILSALHSHFSVSPTAEVTLEANPDDLSSERLEELRSLGINRLSIGIQTFDEATLGYLNRSHSASQALDCISLARKAGFENISADLIFALPPADTSLPRFEKDLKKLILIAPEHVSLYGLTIEDKTVFGNWKRKNRLTEVPEELNALQYELACDLLSKAGYNHYEVSNFAKPGRVSQHNSSYWKGAHYLGLGPGAHSFDGQSRSFNISHNAKYIHDIQAGELPIETEGLSPLQQLNEYVLTRSRTWWGVDFHFIQKNWDVDMWERHHSWMTPLIESGKATYADGVFTLTSRGFALADEVALHFFSTE